MKYYFIFYQCTTYGWNSEGVSTGSHTQLAQDIVDIHPLQWQIDCNKKYGKQHPTHGDHTKREEYLVMNWKELTEEEYNKFSGWIG